MLVVIDNSLDLRISCEIWKFMRKLFEKFQRVTTGLIAYGTAHLSQTRRGRL